MASAARVIVVDPAPHALERAETRLRELEQRWSRFLADSDINRLNCAANTWVPVTAETIALIRTMQLARQVTDGGYDPTYLHELLDAGYTTSIDDRTRISVVMECPCPDHDVNDVRIDMSTMSVLLPTGLALDPGGIGKGFAGDIVVTELLRSGSGGVLVSVGGDIAAGGRAPTPQGWIVDVEDPCDPTSVLTTVALSAGGVATSSTRSRRWKHNGVEHHHVIDPATGRSSHTDLAAVTVVDVAGWRAEAHATAALLRGSAGAISYMRSVGVNGIATTLDGVTTTTPALGAVLAGVGG